MKIVSWNINGIRAVVRKGIVHQLVATYNPDVICLQETSASRANHPGFTRVPLPLLEWRGQKRLCRHRHPFKNGAIVRSSPHRGGLP